MEAQHHKHRHGKWGPESTRWRIRWRQTCTAATTAAPDPLNAGTPLNPAASSASVRNNGLQFAHVAPVKHGDEPASGKTNTIKPAISFIGSIISCGRSAAGGFCRWRCHTRATRQRKQDDQRHNALYKRRGQDGIASHRVAQNTVLRTTISTTIAINTSETIPGDTQAKRCSLLSVSNFL